MPSFALQCSRREKKHSQLLTPQLFLHTTLLHSAAQTHLHCVVAST